MPHQCVFLRHSELTPPPSLVFIDQFVFRLTGSISAAVINILQGVCHSTLLQKLAQMNIPDALCNWLVNFFTGHSHCTMYGGAISSLRQISASIVQGSAIGPALYTVNAADLQAATPGNQLRKYADDTYIIIPVVNKCSRCVKLNHIDLWAKINDIKLNHNKSKEIIITLSCRNKHVRDPPPCLPATECSTLKILDVTITDKLSVSDHIRDVTCKCAQTLHVIRVLCHHGMNYQALQVIYWSVVIAKLLYASSA